MGAEDALEAYGGKEAKGPNRFHFVGKFSYNHCKLIRLFRSILRAAGKSFLNPEDGASINSIPGSSGYKSEVCDTLFLSPETDGMATSENSAPANSGSSWVQA
jgi:hypothetical protein